MARSLLSYCVLLVFSIVFSAVTATVQAEQKPSLSTIPRVDVHAHIRSFELLDDYIAVGKVLKEGHGVNLEVWINVSPLPIKPRGEGVDYFEKVEEKYRGRFLSCLHSEHLYDGFVFSPEDLSEWHIRGVVGHKIWSGFDAIDDPSHAPIFTRMEQIGMVGACVHISQPYPRNVDDPIKFWRAINAWERVLDRHPDLIVVNAHFLNLFYSNEQLEYLQYVLETYPNVYVETAARFKDFYSMDRDKLRNFMIEYSDRILFGTDISRQPQNEPHEETARRYVRVFEALETDKVLPGGFGSTVKEIQGLALPLEVLEKIYFKNAVKVYPRVGEVLAGLGYEDYVKDVPRLHEPRQSKILINRPDLARRRGLHRGKYGSKKK